MTIRVTEEIVVYTTPEKLAHKSYDGPYDVIAWWWFGRPPKDLDSVRRIWFAVRGRVVATAPCSADPPPRSLDGVDEPEFPSSDHGVAWWTDEVETIDDGPECKPFRGFRYRWWETSDDTAQGEGLPA